MERLLTVQETAAYLQVKPSTIYTWAYRSQIPCQKVCGALRFRREDVDAWLQAQTRKPMPAIIARTE